MKNPSRKISSFSRYLLATKLQQCGTRITGDIDSPKDADPAILREWIARAKDLSDGAPPILFVPIYCTDAVSPIIKEISNDVVIGVHGFDHVHYSKLGEKEKIESLSRTLGHGNCFRFPYLDYDRTCLNFIAEHYEMDSSIVSGAMQPFMIGKMAEFPITPPTDTAIRDNPDGLQWSTHYAKLIKQAKAERRFRTFLFHPNPFSVKLMKEISEHL